MTDVNLFGWILLGSWSVGFLGLVVWCVYIHVKHLARWARRRRERRALQRAIAEGVRQVQEQARELGRIARAAQVVHANYVFAAHRELREGVKARA